MIKLLTILPCLLLMFQPLNAKVEKPNYDFSTATLEDFFPGKKIDGIETKYGKGENIHEIQGNQTKKFYVAQIRYKFPVMVQAKEGAILDMFARLPSYFLHDIFFQSLVNKLGKQTSYKKIGEEAVYVWEQTPLRHVYSAACTITCFPIFYSVMPIDKNFNTIMEQMQNKK